MNKFIFITIITFLISVSFISCKKDKDNSLQDYLPGITGGWRVVSEIPENNDKYLWLYSNHTFSILTSGEMGLRGKNAGVTAVSDKQIMLQTGDNYPISIFYNYFLKQDTLTITHTSTNLISKSVLVRDQSVPDTSAWIKPVSAVKIIKAPVNYVTDITYDGTSIWYGNAGVNNYIYKINPSTGAKDSVNISLPANAIEYDGVNLWISDASPSLKKINQANGSLIFTSSDLDYYVNSMARDGNYLWCFSSNKYNLYKYNITDNTSAIMVKLNPDFNITGLAFVNNYLYTVSNGILNKCSVNPLKAVAGFELYGHDIGGVAYDGTSFWVAATHKDSLQQYIYEIIKLAGVE